MRTGESSRAAMAAAVHRAAHQMLEHGRIFHDPLATRILGEPAATAIRQTESAAERRPPRIFAAARCRIAEDRLAAAVQRGVHQLVVLGAGLDTFACRNPFGDRLRVFEVDYPATLGWKRELLRSAGINEPETLRYAGMDLETESLPEVLAQAGFAADGPAFVTLLGVTPHLTSRTIWKTLAWIGSIPGGAEVVFDYADAGTAEEPAESYFETAELHGGLRRCGFVHIEDWGPEQIAERWLREPAGAMAQPLGHIVHAATANR